MSNSVRPHRRQPTRLPRPWDSPGKNTGVGCHVLLQCMKVKSESEVAQSCPTPSDPVVCSLLGSSTHGILQARVLEWGTIAFSGPLYFCTVCYSLSCFISNVVDLILLFFLFLDESGLSVWFIFSKNQLLVLLIFTVVPFISFSLFLL